MKLFATTAAAALMAAGVAHAGDEMKAEAEAGMTADTAVAESEITTELNAGADVDAEPSEYSTHAGAPDADAEAMMETETDIAGDNTPSQYSIHAMTDLDTDADGAVSLGEAQEYDPSVTSESFAEFDADASGALNEEEFAAWEGEMQATGQGDAELESELDEHGAAPSLEAQPSGAAETGIDIDAAMDGEGEVDAEAGMHGGPAE